MQTNYQKEDLEQALATLKSGGIIVYPTDTIWGLGCDATNAQAVEKLFSIKKRTPEKSMLILLENMGMIASYVDEVPDIAWDILELSEKPTTIIFDGAKNIATNLIAPDGSIGIRVTAEKFSADLINRFRKPIVSTSANFAGQKPPLIFADIPTDLTEKADYVVQFRQNDIAPATASSIIKIGKGGLFSIVRP